MMRRNSSILIKWRGIVLAIVLITFVFLEPAYSQLADAVILLQKTPAGGGTITPDTGIHRFDLYRDVTLTAVPKPGYRFVYWLGDVIDPTANSTTVYIDAPKIIIAVFERTDYEFPEEIERMTASHGIGGAYGQAADYSRRGGGGMIKPKGWSRRRRRPPEPEEPEESDIPTPNEPEVPVPDKNADFPAVPEPATIVLLGLGCLLTLTRGRVKRRT